MIVEQTAHSRKLGDGLGTRALGVHRAYPVEPLAWAVCAAIALTFSLMTGLTPHRIWGLTASVGYGGAALLAARRPARTRVRPVFLAAAGAVVLPLCLLIAVDQGQLEVEVVERSGRLLAASGSPYVGTPGALADYNPYLPGMAVFGLLPGDARWWFAVAFTGALAVAVPREGKRRRGTAVAAVAACPLVALPLTVGGVDLPVAGLMCLGLALAGRDRAWLAGFVLGLAATLKWTAWPALPVACALLAVRAGRGPALRCGALALAVAGAVVLPFALGDADGFLRNVVDFPLGLTAVRSPAATPFPGRLLADHVPGGALVAAGLLALGAVLIGASLLKRPPRTVGAAAARLALGLTFAIAFMPATRFGYLVYPLVLLACFFSPSEGGRFLAPHARRHQRLPATTGRYRDLREGDDGPVPAGRGRGVRLLGARR